MRSMTRCDADASSNLVSCSSISNPVSYLLTGLFCLKRKLSLSQRQSAPRSKDERWQRKLSICALGQVSSRSPLPGASEDRTNWQQLP